MRIVRAVLLSFLVLPLFAAGHDITPPTYAPSAYQQSAPVVATNGETFLSLWTLTAMDAGPYVFGSLADAAGNVLTPISFLVAPHSSVIQVFSSGKDYVALLTDVGGSYRVARIDAHGHLISLSSAGTAADRNRLIATSSRAAFDGSHFFVLAVDYSSGQVIARFVDMNGVASEQSLWRFEGPFDVVATADGFVVLAANHFEVFLARFGKGGGAVGLRLPFAPEIAEALAIVANGSNFAAAWMHTDDLVCGTCREHILTAATLRADGTIVGRHQIVTPPINNLTMLWNGHTYILVEQTTTGAFAARVDEQGVFVDQPVPIGSGVAAAVSGNVLYSVGNGSISPSVVGAASTLDAAGIHAAAAQRLSTTFRRQSIDAIATDGVDFLTTWADQSAQNLSGRAAARLTPDAMPLDNSQIDVDPIGWIGRARSSVAFGHSVYLVVWNDVSRVLARRVSPNGLVLDAQPIVIGNGSVAEHAIAWDGNRFFVVWSEGTTTVRGTFVDEMGIAQNAVRLERMYPASVVWDGSYFLLALFTYSGTVLDFPVPGGIAIARLRPDGIVVDQAFVDTAPARFHIATSKHDSLLVVDPSWCCRANAILAYAIHTGDKLTVDPPVSVFTTFADIASDVAWNGNSYTVAWHSGYGDAWSLSTARVSGSSIFNPITAMTARPDVLNSPAIAVNETAQAVITVSEFQPSYGAARARAYAESELHAMPPLPATPRITSAVVTGSETVIEWESDGIAVAGFAIEQVNGSKASLVVRAEADARSARVGYKVDAVRMRAFGPGGLSQASATVAVTSPARRRTASR
jgi:hypothetical protein